MAFAQWCRMRAKGTFWEQLPWTRRKHSRASLSVGHRVKSQRREKQGSPHRMEGRQFAQLVTWVPEAFLFLMPPCLMPYWTSSTEDKYEIPGYLSEKVCLWRAWLWWVSVIYGVHFGDGVIQGRPMQAHPDKLLKPRQLRRWRLPCGSDPGKLWTVSQNPTCGLFLQMKFHLDIATLTQLCIIYGQVHVTTTELSSCDRL